MNEIKWLKERLRDFGIVNLVKAVNAWVRSAFGNVFHIYFVSFKLFFYQIYHVLSNHDNFGRGRGGRAGINKNVTYAGSQLTF